MTGSKQPGHLRKWRYPFKKEFYEEVGDGTVKVTRDDGRSGIFTLDGRCISGDLTQANIGMLVWTGSPHLPEECDWCWKEVPIDTSRPSGWPEKLEKTLSYQLGRRN